MEKHGGYFGGDKEVIDFSVNVNPNGISKKIKETLINAIEDIEKYPETDAASKSALIASKLNVEKENIIMGNGATEIIYLFFKAMNFKKVIVVQPTFSEYKKAMKINKTEVIEFVVDESTNFKPDMKKLIELSKKEDAECIVICNPNNPSGTFIKKEEFKELIKYSKENSKNLFVDESFLEFTKEESLEEYVKEAPLFLLRSMTKFWAVPGVRVGYGIGREDIIEKMYKYKEPWTLNAFALSIVDLLFEDEKYIKDTLKWVDEQRKYMFEELSSIERIKVIKSSTNFHLCKLKEGSVLNLQETLLKKHKLYIRTCEEFKGLNESWFRIAVRTKKQNEKLIEALKLELGGE